MCDLASTEFNSTHPMFGLVTMVTVAGIFFGCAPCCPALIRRMSDQNKLNISHTSHNL
uniref:Uncharacterized protein n=1 Tax=Anguilla anguilla TaxID=7936 RepID=A0A0E9XX28_ANGAN